MAAKGKKVRLVSMPSTNTFDAQDEAYKQSVLPAAVTRRVAVEAGVTAAWWQYVGLHGEIVGINHFGASAPAKDLFKAYGFTADHVVAAIEKVLS
jgi:transketolase